MKKIIAWILIFLSASISGILSSSYVVFFVLEKEQMALTEVFGFEFSHDVEATLRAAYDNASNAEDGDLDKILSRSCFYLNSYLEYLDTSIYEESPERKRELDDFAEQVKQKGDALQMAGYCDV